MLIDMLEFWKARSDFGKKLRELRSSAGWTLRQMHETTGISFGVIASIEVGERVASPEAAVKLADAFGLVEKEREEFLLLAAATRKRDRLMQVSRTLPAALLNFIPQILMRRGVNIDHIGQCNIEERTEGEQQLTIAMEDGQKLLCRLEVEAA
jgi:transcriptional regulator with XRE-family HTH domain